VEAARLFADYRARNITNVRSLLRFANVSHLRLQYYNGHANDGTMAVHARQLHYLRRVSDLMIPDRQGKSKKHISDLLFLCRNVTYFFEDDVVKSANAGDQCVCPPEPKRFTMEALRILMRFFCVEWVVRVLTFVPEDTNITAFQHLLEWLGYLTSPGTLIDALATFSYYLETIPNTFISLRLLRLFRIFQLVRLGQYNTLFLTLTNVMGKSLNYLRLLILILAFGGAFFGSMIYWLEKGTWQYYEETGTFLFVRMGVDGITLEPSPFRSIPDAFWWFLVTATTVGYGGK